MKTKEAKNKASTSKAHRYQVFGFPVTRVIRTLGKAGFTYQETKKSLAAMHVKPAEPTLRANISIGSRLRKGSDKFAPLSEEQLTELRGYLQEEKHEETPAEVATS